MIGLPYGEKKLWPYVKPFSSDTGTLRTDGRTDGRTGRFAISISRVSVLTRDKNSRVCQIHMSKPTVQQYRRCCHLGNGNKTCRSLLLFKNNNVARRSQGFVRQSSRNVALRVEQPSLLNKFFFRINVKNCWFITLCKAHSKVTHKTAKIFSSPQAPWI